MEGEESSLTGTLALKEPEVKEGPHVGPLQLMAVGFDTRECGV